MFLCAFVVKNGRENVISVLQPGCKIPANNLVSVINPHLWAISSFVRQAPPAKMIMFAAWAGQIKG
jgi:hypothetical protein